MISPTRLSSAVPSRVAGQSFTPRPRRASGGRTDEYERTNVQGTRNVIEACRAHGARRIIYSSSPSVVFNGLDMEGVDESVPYSRTFEAAYPATKARAEQIILGSNGDSLATICAASPPDLGPGRQQPAAADPRTRQAAAGSDGSAGATL